MKKWLLWMIFTAVFAAPMAFSQDILEVGNKYCPVSADEVSGKHFAEHGGKRYGFCCNQCIKKFSQNPEKYISNSGTGHEAHDHGHAHHHEV